MPAYSFMPQFVAPIRAGTKGGTIRAARKPANRGIHSTARQAIGGHAYPGEILRLYCRQRHPSGFLISQVECLLSVRITLDFAKRAVMLNGGLISFPLLLDKFALFDGFETFEQMAEFWRKTHGTDCFDGWHIRWKPLNV